MQLSSAPAKLTVAFATSGSKNSIPVASSGVPGSASYDGGFPPETMEPVNAGGVPPSGKDFNGLFNEMTAVEIWANAGGFYTYDAGFATAVGGYPKGALVFKASGDGYWRCTTDNNTSDPDTGGSGWVSLGSAIAPSTSSSVYASAQQTLATGNAKVLFDTTEFDAGLWDAADKRFVAPFAGKFRVNGAVMLSAPDGQLLAIQIWKNGALAKQCFQAPQVSTGNLSLPFDAIINCASGDYLEVFAVVPDTSVLAGQAGSNQAYVFAQCEYLGS